MKKIVIALLLVLAGCAAWYFICSGKEKKSDEVGYRTAVIGRMNVVQEVSATGKISPIKEVEVGTQVTGEIVSLSADFNSRVKEGEVIAQIDPRTYDAAYANAKARLKSNEAAMAKTKVQLDLAEKELKRIAKLAEKSMVSESEYDIAVASRDALKATLMANEAAIEESRASVDQAETNLDYCTIFSPVTGIVISRDVDEGQTVVSNMSTSTLFRIATDLSRIQVEASVPEADVGGIRVGQKVTFTVDAYKDTFTGVVTQIRLASSTNSNVVTYPVIVEADNPEEKLFPGMTANLAIITAERDDVLTIPMAALRFSPDFAMADETGNSIPPQLKDGEKPELPEGVKLEGPAPEVEPGADTRTIWLQNSDGSIRPYPVVIGISDSVNQEIVGAEALEGMRVIIGKQRKSAVGQQGGNNPFAPKPPPFRNSQKRSNRN